MNKNMEPLANAQDMIFTVKSFSLKGQMISFLQYDWKIELFTTADAICAIQRVNGVVSCVGDIPATAEVTDEKVFIFASSADHPFGRGKLKYKATIFCPSEHYSSGVQVLKTINGYTEYEISSQGEPSFAGEIQVVVTFPLSEASAQEIAQAVAVESSRATEREDAIEEELNTEHDRAIDAEAGLDNRIDTVAATIPSVVDNVTSTAEDDALSAKQGKLLNDRINNLQSRGRFLALWDCTTGLPLSNPSVFPYAYHTGDYFRISSVGATNYMPEGSFYEGEASTTEYSGEVASGDCWFFDGTSWQLEVNHIGGIVQDVEEEGVSIVSGGIAHLTKAVFWATYGTTTYAKVTEAIAAKKDVKTIVEGGVLSYSYSYNNTLYFSGYINAGSKKLYVARLYPTNEWNYYTKTLAYSDDLNTKQDTLVSGSNIKTINGNSIIGSGDITIKAETPKNTWPADDVLHPGTWYAGTLDGTHNVTLATERIGLLPIYAGRITCGAAAPAITFSGVTWMGGSAPIFEANKVYEFNILDGIGICKEIS